MKVKYSAPTIEFIRMNSLHTLLENFSVDAYYEEFEYEGEV